MRSIFLVLSFLAASLATLFAQPTTPACIACIPVAQVGSSNEPIRLPKLGENAKLDSFVLKDAKLFLKDNTYITPTRLVGYQQIAWISNYYFLFADIATSKGVNISVGIALEQLQHEIRVNPVILHPISPSPRGVKPTRYACLNGKESNGFGDCSFTLKVLPGDLGYVECHCDKGNSTAMHLDSDAKEQ